MTSSTNDPYPPAVVIDIRRLPADRVEGCQADLVVTVVGELDIVAEQSLTDAVGAAIVEQGPSRVALDLSAVTFLDACGVAAIIRCRQAVHASGAMFTLTHPSRHVRHLLRLLALHNLLPALCDPQTPCAHEGPPAPVEPIGEAPAVLGQPGLIA